MFLHWNGRTQDKMSVVLDLISIKYQGPGTLNKIIGARYTQLNNRGPVHSINTRGPVHEAT